MTYKDKASYGFSPPPTILHTCSRPRGHQTWLCNTLKHTATHCNTLQRAATHFNSLQHTGRMQQYSNALHTCDRPSEWHTHTHTHSHTHTHTHTQKTLRMTTITPFRQDFYLYLRHDSFICETWLNTDDHDSFRQDFYSCVCHDSFICETWLICMRDMTYFYVRHDSFTCGTWLITDDHDSFEARFVFLFET